MAQPEDRIKDKVALVTGGSKGIGYAVAEALVRRGADVVVAARAPGEVEAAAGRLSETGPGRAIGVSADVRDYGQVETAVGAAVSSFGRLDVLVVNAGLGLTKPVWEFAPEEWRAVLETNLSGAFHCVRAAARELRARSGYLFTVSSLAGSHPFKGGAAYCASKAGLDAFTEAVMQDFREAGVKVSTIAPGSVATGFSGREPGAGEAWKIRPEDIGALVVNLLDMHPRTLPSRVEVRPARTKA